MSHVALCAGLEKQRPSPDLPCFHIGVTVKLSDWGEEAITPVPLTVFRFVLVVVLAGLLAGCGVDEIATSIGSGLFAIVGLMPAIGGILGALARLRNWKVWVGAAIFPIAAVGALLASPSFAAFTDRFFVTLILLSSLGIAAFLTVGLGNSARNSRFRSGEVGREGFGGGGRYGGGGASGSW